MFIPLLGAIVVLMVLASLSVSPAGEDRQATEANGRLEFKPNQKNFLGVALFIVFLCYVIVAGLLSPGRSSAHFVAPACCAAFIILLSMAFPGTITTDQDGLEQKYWMGHRRRIAWKDVAQVTVNEKKSEVKIKSKQGVKIVHPRQLPDRARLLKELHEHCTETLIPTVAPVEKPLAMSGPAA
jgi:hypothetical protein